MDECSHGSAVAPSAITAIHPLGVSLEVKEKELLRETRRNLNYRPAATGSCRFFYMYCSACIFRSSTFGVCESNKIAFCLQFWNNLLAFSLLNVGEYGVKLVFHRFGNVG